MRVSPDLGVGGIEDVYGARTRGLGRRAHIFGRGHGESACRACKDGLPRRDTAFHEAFFASCGNSYLSETYALYVGKIAALRTHLAVKPAHTDKSYAEHREMLALLRGGELQAALGVLDTHIARTKTTYSAGVEDIAAADRAAALAKITGSGLNAVPPRKSTGTS